MAIRYYNDGSDFRLRAKGRVAEWIAECVRAEGRSLGGVNFIFCSPERQLEINRGFLGHDWPTDVITFDYTEGDKISGDIFIDPAEVERNARELFVAVAVEMRRVMLHGCLHLCGHGDKTPRERKEMRATEDFYLKRYYAGV